MGYSIYVGVDWGETAHQVSTIQADGSDPRQRSFEHSGRGLEDLVSWLMELSNNTPESVAVALEVPRGALVDTLLERGFAVFALNPKQLDRFRDRYTIAGAKDDRRDALVLAQSLRTDMGAYRRVNPEDPYVVRLREWTRLEEELKQEHRRISNRLRAQLNRYYPQLLRLVPAADEPWLWALLEQAPTPEQGKRLRRSVIARLLKEYRIRRVTADEVRAQLTAQSLRPAPGVVEAASSHVLILAAQLQLVTRQMRDVDAAIRHELKALSAAAEDGKREHRDVKVLLSLPGAGTFVVATMLAEATEPLRERDYHALRTRSGLAPVTKQSGKSLRVEMRRACNPRLRNACFHWASVAVQLDPRLGALYRDHRTRGQSHARTLRSVADRLLRLTVVLLQRGADYDPSLRQLAA